MDFHVVVVVIVVVVVVVVVGVVVVVVVVIVIVIVECVLIVSLFCENYFWSCRFTKQADTKHSRLGGILEQKAHRGDGAAVGGTIVDIAASLALEVGFMLLDGMVRHKTPNTFEITRGSGTWGIRRTSCRRRLDPILNIC